MANVEAMGNDINSTDHALIYGNASTPKSRRSNPNPMLLSQKSQSSLRKKARRVELVKIFLVGALFNLSFAIPGLLLPRFVATLAYGPNL